MAKSAAEIIGLDAIKALRDAGFVVVHQVPSRDMVEAGGSAVGFCDGSLDTAWHRMVAASIRKQNE